MRNDTVAGWLACMSLMLASVVAPAAAKTTLAFDRPAKVIVIPPSTKPSSDYAVTCYVYDDVMIRVADSHSPMPDDAVILPGPKKAAPQNCEHSRPDGIKLSSRGTYLDGRLGDFLVFELADPTGSSQFAVFNVRNGRELYRDGKFGGNGYLGVYGITSATVTGHILHMRYRRGVNTTCSLLSDRDKCWAQLLSSGDVPRGLFSAPPTLEYCKKNYADDDLGPAPDDDPSIVS